MVVGFRCHTRKELANELQDVPNLTDIQGVRPYVQEAVMCDGWAAMDRARVYRLHSNL
ncbi:MAG: hypothetical protein OXC19_02835 [Bryobacterales bacterium]|nr:hypothetical protein [Bryobacterales bacterium]